MGKFWDSIKSGFTSFGKWAGTATKDTFNFGKSAVTSVYNDVKGIGTRVLAKGESLIDKPFEMVNKYLLIGGVAIGGILLFSLMNPGSTERIITTGMSTAGEVAGKAAPIAGML